MLAYVDVSGFDRAELCFRDVFGRFCAESKPTQWFIGSLGEELRREVMAPVIRLHGTWVQRYLRALPPVNIDLVSGWSMGAETAIRSKAVKIYLPIQMLIAASKRSDKRDVTARKFGKIVGHEIVHVVQLLTGQFTTRQLIDSGCGTTGSTFTADTAYLSAAHEIEAYAHSIAFELICILRERDSDSEPFVADRYRMASLSQSYRMYVELVNEATLAVLDAMIARLVGKHFAT